LAASTIRFCHRAIAEHTAPAKSAGVLDALAVLDPVVLDPAADDALGGGDALFESFEHATTSMDANSSAMTRFIREESRSGR
jgi:hypothetical protein